MTEQTMKGQTGWYTRPVLFVADLNRTLDDWRELYRLARRDAGLRARLVRVVSRVPLGFPHFWRAALASLGEPVDFDAPVPEDLGPT